jgi:uncharacterized membrane protein YdbT with pleckstrin-like domain
MAEKTLYKTHPLPFINNPTFYLISFILIAAAMALNFWIFLLVCLIFLVVLYFSYSRVTLIITEERITLKEGLASRATNDVYHSNVSNIRITQSLIERLLDVGTIEIASSATSGYEMTVSGVPDPKKVKTIIEEQKGRERI